MRKRASVCALLAISLGCLQSIHANDPGPVARPAVPLQTRVDMSYIDSTFAAGVIVRPSQAMQSDFGKTLIQNAFEAAEFDQLTGEFSQNFGVELQDVKQLSVLLNEKAMAAGAGIDLPNAGETRPAIGAAVLKNNLRQIALGFHNYHDANRSFPPANGKLSWRVHILPYVGQPELYEQFAMDEDWDSETNKPLIEKMPELFKSPGVEAAGKTSLHVFAGKGGPFERDLRIAQCIDGTSLTMMTVLAGPDTASEWTKPGGLEIDKDNPWKPLGTLRTGSLLCSMMDGSVDGISEDTADEVLLAAMTHNGREIVGHDRIFPRQSGPNPAELPTIIAHCLKPVDQVKAIATLGKGLGEPKQKKGNGKEYWDVGGYAIWFPTDRTMVATQAELLPRLMSNRQDDSKLRRFASKHALSDAFALGDTESMPTMFGVMSENAPLPNLAAVTDAWLAIDVTSPQRPLLSANLGMTNENSARGMQALLGASLAMGQQSLGQAAPPGMEPFVNMVSELMKGRRVELDGKALSYTVPKPDDYSTVVKSMASEFKKLGEGIRTARGAAERVIQKNKLKQIGLAFHNYHAVYNTFCAADGSTKTRKGGLSWRVHLLPFMEEVELYQKFRLNEPWDSEHNKALIAEMPDFYKSEGVDGVGKSAIHVFLGNGAMFGDGKSLVRFRDILDGTSNTILAVEAGSDTAAIWTKPGGLNFNPNDPLAALGNIGDTFNALFADGSVRSMLKDGDEDDLAAYITRAGGEVVP